ncbi:ankyrin repeat domain-containing protein [Moritella marina ATCC 15381]|uniref:Ankyrin repeat domain-containing protein n=2 Tax=Moritella marina TaxID=90736 RepID=A0A5J6WLV9_MORMI|nr:ankyrin repeat domain-containing protein [Moritella marina ATCC 15381]
MMMRNNLLFKAIISHILNELSTNKMLNPKKIFPLIFLILPVLSLLVIINLHASELTVHEGYDELTPYYHAAARTGDDEVVIEFLNAGLPIDIKNHKGYTALMIATYNGNRSIVNTLIKRGTDVCAEDNKGNTALMAAIFRAEFTIAKMLLKSDCDANQQNKAGQTAVMYATLFGRKELRSLLIKRGADVLLKDNSGNSADSIQEY